MQTKNGTRVTKLTKLDSCYVGIVNGTLMQWNLEGRRTGRNKSKFDLVMDLDKPVYANVYYSGGTKRISGKRYETKNDAVNDAPRGYIKTIEL